MGGKVEKITSLENCLDVAEALEEMTEARRVLGSVRLCGAGHGKP